MSNPVPPPSRTFRVQQRLSQALKEAGMEVPDLQSAEIIEALINLIAVNAAVAVDDTSPQTAEVLSQTVERVLRQRLTSTLALRAASIEAKGATRN